MKAKSHQSLKYITCSDSVAASWCSLWDHALDYGTKGTKLLQILFSSLCQPLFSDRHYHHCENSILPANECFFSHFTGPGTGRGRGYLLPSFSYHSQTLFPSQRGGVWERDYGGATTITCAQFLLIQHGEMYANLPS